MNRWLAMPTALANWRIRTELPSGVGRVVFSCYHLLSWLRLLISEALALAEAAFFRSYFFRYTYKDLLSSKNNLNDRDFVELNEFSYWGYMSYGSFAETGG